MFITLRKYLWRMRQLPKGSYSLSSMFLNFNSWKHSLRPGSNTLSDGMPWMTFDAIRFLQKNIKPDMKVFEYGMGGSTLFFTKLAKEVVSVEHDEEWFNAARKYFEEKGIKNCQPLFIKPEKKIRDGNEDPSDPTTYSTKDNNWQNYLFEKYVKSIDGFPDDYFDLIVVDGRSRPSCILHSVSKLKGGGMILLDNADRSHYQKAINDFITNGFSDVINRYGPTAYSEDFTKTLIRRKK